MTPVAQRAVVIGTGSIGASLAVAARRAGAFGHVVGVGRGRANLALALATGLVDEVTQDPLGAVVDADLVVLATPVDTAVELLGGLVAAAPAHAVFTDVGSVKQPIVAAAAACGVTERFVGGHPIAGGTAAGAAAADAELFRGRTVVVRPAADSDPAACATVRAMWEAIGASVTEMTAARHDEILALTSHLPQFVAFALCASVGRDGGIAPALFGSGFRDTTRLALSDHDMWLAIARLNKESVLRAMDGFTSLWSELRAAIVADDEAALRRIMQEARACKDRSSS
jgi:prephenate dehydrogenase